MFWCLFEVVFYFAAVIGHGRTVLKYFAKDEGMLSFANNKPVKIFSKGAGSNPDLWGVMVSRQTSDQSAQSNVCFTF